MKVRELRDLLKLERITDDTDVILLNNVGAPSTTEPDFDVVEIECDGASKECIVITPGDEIKIKQ